MITASGPGFFRVLRHTRELLSCRLFKPTRFTNYYDIPERPEADFRNFKSVESTYFCMAFMLTNAYIAWTLFQMGVWTQPATPNPAGGDPYEWRTLMSIFIFIPVLAIIISILVRYTPLMNDTPDNHHAAVRFFAFNKDWDFYF